MWQALDNWNIRISETEQKAEYFLFNAHQIMEEYFVGWISANLDNWSSDKWLDKFSGSTFAQSLYYAATICEMKDKPVVLHNTLPLIV